jgi:hypothetical protein
VWVNHDTGLMDIPIWGSGATATIHATRKHLFWNDTRHAWIEADQLNAGDRLRTDNGATASVASTAVVPGVADMWDLTVQTTHDFYVTTTAANVVVHNCRELWKPTRDGSSATMRGGPMNTVFYQSKADGTWWTADTAGHGGSAFKVYERTSKGLRWIKDADQYGDYIDGKWKGGTGYFIPNSMLGGG